MEKLQILLKESEDAYKKLLGEKESEKQARSEAVREVSSLKDLLEEIEAENEDLTRLSDMQDEVNLASSNIIFLTQKGSGSL